jgi:pimeloyl-ACP methyl ester carboxylesterase
MKKSIIIYSFLCTTTIFSSSLELLSQQVPFTAEEITFYSGDFKLVGELKLPRGNELHGVVIFVHGDGPNDRTSGGSYPPIMERMLSAGFATFAWDKPGTGESTGSLIRSELFMQRAGIVLDGIEVLKKHPSINQNMIGLWGISQAGYVMARVLEESKDIEFMIAVSCPGEASVAQTSYLISRQAICAGIDSAEARKIERLYEAAERAQTYGEYVNYKSKIDSFPALEKMGIKMRVRPENEWEKPDLNGKYYFDPMKIVEKIKITVLVFFGEKDTQADPVQGVAAWRKAFEKAGNKNYQIELIPGVDHCMFISKTGCLEEAFNREVTRYEPLFLNIIEEWLLNIK